MFGANTHTCEEQQELTHQMKVSLSHFFTYFNLAPILWVVIPSRPVSKLVPLLPVSFPSPACPLRSFVLLPFLYHTYALHWGCFPIYFCPRGRVRGENVTGTLRIIECSWALTRWPVPSSGCSTSCQLLWRASQWHWWHGSPTEAAPLPFFWCQWWSASVWLPFLCHGHFAADAGVSPFSCAQCWSCLCSWEECAVVLGECCVGLRKCSPCVCVPWPASPWEPWPLGETWTPFPEAWLPTINQAVQIACFVIKSTSANVCVISCCLPRLFHTVTWSRAFSGCPGCSGISCVLKAMAKGAGLYFQRK